MTFTTMLVIVKLWLGGNAALFIQQIAMYAWRRHDESAREAISRRAEEASYT